MRTKRSHPIVVPSFIVLLIAASGATADLNVARGSGATTPPNAPDSLRLEPSELQQLLANAVSNTQSDPAVTVEGNPVFTDRGFIHVTAADFTPLTTKDPTQFYEVSGYFWFDDGFIRGEGFHYDTDAVAAVHLPEGVTVDRVAMLAVDDDQVSDLHLSLSRYRAFFDSSEFMSNISTDGTNTSQILSWQDVTIDHPVVSNGFYQYRLHVDGLMGKVKLRSVFIIYSY